MPRSGPGASGGAPILLAGLTSLAALGALRAAARPLLRRYGYLLVVAFAAPLAAATYTGEGGPGHFFAADVPRLLIYALPVLIALALVAVDRVWPHRGSPGAEVRPPASVRVMAALGAARGGGPPVRSPSIVIGAPTSAGPATDRTSWPSSARASAPPAGSSAARPSPSTPRSSASPGGSPTPASWTACAGSCAEGGAAAHYGTGEIMMQEGAGDADRSLLPAAGAGPGARDRASRGTRLTVAVNGRPVGETPPRRPRRHEAPRGGLSSAATTSCRVVLDGPGATRLRVYGLVRPLMRAPPPPLPRSTTRRRAD